MLKMMLLCALCTDDGIIKNKSINYSDHIAPLILI